MLSPQSLRERVSDGILSALSASGWTTSPYTYDLFGSDPRTLLHLSYAVGLGTTAPLGDRHVRGVGTTGTYVETDVLIRYASQINADTQVADYDDALTAERALAAAAMRVQPLPGLALYFGGIRRREVVADGTVYLGECVLTCRHHLEL